MPTPSSSRPRGAAAAAPPSAGLFTFSCSCKNAKAVSVSPSPLSSSASASTAIASTSPSSSSPSTLLRHVASPEPPNSHALERRGAAHRRCASEGGRRRGEGRRKVRESVAVVKETEDPVGDFRRSMVAMIVEKRMDTGEELRELLAWFLALNSPDNHRLVLRAFAQVWEDVFLPRARLLLQPSGRETHLVN